ncbi:MAG: hypothetical protein PVF70_08440 [Anaerolineales bacterium]
MQKVLLDEYSDADLNIIIVWLKMYEADSLDVVHEASKLYIKDARVSQFYDPERLVGREVATRFGANPGEVAWDVYLFFDPHSAWNELLPLPEDWAHQLTSSNWVDPRRLFQGDQLKDKLREIAENLLRKATDA